MTVLKNAGVLAITGATIIDGNGGGAIEDGVILVEARNRRGEQQIYRDSIAGKKACSIG